METLELEYDEPNGYYYFPDKTTPVCGVEGIGGVRGEKRLVCVGVG